MRRTCLPAAPIKAPCTMFKNTTPKPLPNNTENNTMTVGQNKDLHCTVDTFTTSHTLQLA